MNLQDFNINTIGDWPAIHRYIIAISSGLIIFILFFFFFIFPQYSQLSQDRSTENTLKQQLALLTEQVIIFNEKNQRLTAIKELLSLKSKQLPQQQHLGVTLESLNKFATQDELNLFLLKPEEAIQENDFIKIPIKISVLGNYTQLSTFIDQISRMQYYLYLNKMNVSLVNNDTENNSNNLETLKLEMLAEFYYLATPVNKNK